LRTTEIADARRGAQAKAVAVDERLGFGDHALRIDAPAEGARLAQDEEVLRHRAVRQDAQLLEDHRDAAIEPLAQRQRRDVLAIEDDTAAIRRVDPDEDLHQGRFAGAVLTEQGVCFARVDDEIDVDQNLIFAKRLPDPLHRYGDAGRMRRSTRQ
jgi:hypothetical protein